MFWLMSVSEDLEFLKSKEDGDVEVVSRTLKDDMWIVAYMLDDGPVKYHLYHRSTRRLEYLFSNNAELATVPLAKMQPVIIKSRDGSRPGELLHPAGRESGEGPTIPHPAPSNRAASTRRSLGSG